MRCCPHCHRVWREAHEFCPSDGKELKPVAPGKDDPLVGVELDGRYRLTGLLGIGGMGFVYRGEQIGLGRELAIKMLYAERTREREAVKRFAREARTLAALDHPSIVRIVDYGEGGGATPYIAMEVVEGPSLEEILQIHQKLAPKHAVDVAIELAEAVHAAHQQGITHRDLKPGNVHLDERAGKVAVRILDFGLARLDQNLDSGSASRLTTMGVVAGTPAYMAPEQIRGNETDGRTDLYALGVVLYELLTGLTPFCAGTPQAVISAHLEDPVPKLVVDGLPAETSKALNGIVHRLMAKDPEERPASGKIVAEALRDIARRLPDVGPLDPLVRDLMRTPGLGTDDPTLDGPEPGGAPLSEPPWNGLAGSKTADQELARMISGARRRRRAFFAVGAAAIGAIAVVAIPYIRSSMRTRAPRSASRLEVVELPSTASQPPSASEARAEGLAVAPAPADEEILIDRNAKVVTELPGGDRQTAYEDMRRSVERSLAPRGLRFRDVRFHPTLTQHWTAQDRAARMGNFEQATEHLEALEEAAADTPIEEILVSRLRGVQRKIQPDTDRIHVATLRALRATVSRASTSRDETRRFVRRLDEVERELR